MTSTYKSVRNDAKFTSVTAASGNFEDLSSTNGGGGSGGGSVSQYLEKTIDELSINDPVYLDDDYYAITSIPIQIGSDIDGDPGDQFGTSVSMNADGTIVAIGAPNANSATGLVRIYENSGGSWTKIGDDIPGDATNEDFGISVSINADGTIVAIGASNANSATGLVRIYENSGGSWTKIGDIPGDATTENFGFSVSLNADGTIVAIGAPGASAGSPPETNSGLVRIYEYSGGSWVKIGSDIDGNTAFDFFGNSVSMNSAGTIVAIGSGSYSGNIGYVGIYENITIPGTWTKIGSDITSNQQFETSVSLNDAGTILAFGAPSSSNNTGFFIVYENITNPGTWTQRGLTIPGNAENIRFGASVSINADGTIVAVSAPDSDIGATNSGFVSAYEYISGIWTLIGTTVYGNAENDSFGKSVSINSAGTIISGGAPAVGNIGYVKVFNITSQNFTGVVSNITDNDLPDPSNRLVTVHNTGIYELPFNPTADVPGFVEPNVLDWVYTGSKTSNSIGVVIGIDEPNNIVRVNFF